MWGSVMHVVDSSATISDAIAEAIERATEPPPGPTIFELRHDDCRWPLGALHDAVRFFCGAPALVGRPYCSEHHKLATIHSGSKASAKAWW